FHSVSLRFFDRSKTADTFLGFDVLHDLHAVRLHLFDEITEAVHPEVENEALRDAEEVAVGWEQREDGRALLLNPGFVVDIQVVDTKMLRVPSIECHWV